MSRFRWSQKPLTITLVTVLMTTLIMIVPPYTSKTQKPGNGLSVIPQVLSVTITFIKKLKTELPAKLRKTAKSQSGSVGSNQLPEGL